MNSKLLYKGITGGLKNRTAEHNSGKVKSTKSHRPWKLIYCEAYSNKTLAKKTELFYKTTKVGNS